MDSCCENNDGYLVEIENNENIFHSILIKQNVQDCYFYVFSTSNEDKLSKKIFKQIKKSGLKIKKIRNDELKNLFYNDTQDIINVDIGRQQTTDIATVYDFSDNAQAQFDAQLDKYLGLKSQGRMVISENKHTQTDANVIFSPLDEISSTHTQKIEKVVPISPLQGIVIHIPAGYELEVVLQSSISSQSVVQNDIITAILENDWVYNGNLIAPSGSILYGQVIDAQKAGYAHGNGEIEITFKEILSTTGTKISLPNNIVKLSTQINRPVKIAADVIAGSVVGIATGVIYALISGGNVSRGVIYGASAGGAGGLVRSSLQKGQEIEISTGTKLQIKLLDAMNFVPVY